MNFFKIVKKDFAKKVAIGSGIAGIIGLPFTVFTSNDKIEISGDNNTTIVGNNNINNQTINNADNSTNHVVNNINNYNSHTIVNELYPNILNEYLNVDIKKVLQDFGTPSYIHEKSENVVDVSNNPIYHEMTHCNVYHYNLKNGNIAFYDNDNVTTAILVELKKPFSTYLKIPKIYIDVDTLKYSLGISRFKDFCKTIDCVIEKDFAKYSAATNYTYLKFSLMGDDDLYNFYIGDNLHYYETKSEMNRVIPNHLFIYH